MLEAMICLHEDICLIGEKIVKREENISELVPMYVFFVFASSSSVKYPISYHVLSCFVYLLAYFANKLFFEDGFFSNIILSEIN